MIVVDDSGRYRSLPPVRKLLTLVFALAEKDRATGLRLDYSPDPPACRMWYCVAGVMYEMVPPPAHLWPDLFGLLWREASLDPGARPGWWQRLWRRAAFPETPVGGTLTVRVGSMPVAFDILFFRGRAGEHIQIHKTSPLDASQVATQFLSQALNRVIKKN